MHGIVLVFAAWELDCLTSLTKQESGDCVTISVLPHWIDVNDAASVEHFDSADASHSMH